MNADRRARVREIFIEVCELPPDEQAAALDRLCAGDAELRAEVERTLSAERAAADFMAHPTGDQVPASALRSTASAPITERVGERIGPYKLLQRIGEGGFGTVFLAEQVEPVRRRVALKIIKLGMDTRQVIARFEAERQALAMMDHPHIARVFDGGATPVTDQGGGRPYFVMEYVVGDAITTFADARKLTVRERLELFAQVCAAVQHAHTKGIIHRDLKPGNVLVSMVDGKPHAKVIDFGIAKATAGGAARLTDKTYFTEHRQLIGTPEYMSPEQAEGSPDIDTRTDVYALGVLLYELLTGLTPFDAKRLRSAAWLELQRIIREEDPPAPSVRLSRSLVTLASTAAARGVEPARLSGIIKGELDWIAMKALDKDRARRYETPNQLAADVESHLRGEPVQAAPPSAAYRLRKFVRKHRGSVLTGGAITAALLLGFVGTSLGLWRAARAVEATGEALDREQGARADAEWNAYAAYLALAQNAIAANAWPEVRERLAQCPEALRGFEWATLNARAVVTQAVLPDARYRALHPDGTRILTASDDDTARLWDLDGRPLGEVMRHDEYSHAEYSVGSAVFSPDGTRILTASDDGTARLWDLDGRPLGEVMRHDNSYSMSCAFFSPDGTRILTASYEHTARLWDLAGRPLGQVMRHDHWVISAVFSPDGTRILTADYGGTARQWDLDGRPLGEVMRHDTWVNSAVFSPDGTRILTASGDGTARQWDLDGRPLGEVMRHDAGVSSAVFSPDGTRILTASWDGTARLWDLDGRPLAEARSITRIYNHVAEAEFTPDGLRGLLSIGYADDAVEVVSTEDFSAPRRPLSSDPLLADLEAAALLDQPLPDPPAAAASTAADAPGALATARTPDGSRQFVATPDGRVRVLLPETQRELAVFRVPAAATALRFSPNGDLLLLTLANGVTEVWDTRPAAEQGADLGRRWDAERAARGWVDELLAGPLAPQEIERVIADSAAHTPLQRLGAADALRERQRQFAREAERILADFQKEHIMPERVRAAAAALSGPHWRVVEGVREKAAQWTPEAKKLYELAWAAARTTEASPERLAAALEAAGQAVEALPEDGFARRTLGAVQFRLGRYSDALETLQAADGLIRESNDARYRGGLPSCIMFLAMAQHRLGQSDQAAESLTRLRALAASEAWRDEKEVAACLAEAEAFIRSD